MQSMHDVNEVEVTEEVRRMGWDGMGLDDWDPGKCVLTGHNLTMAANLPFLTSCVIE